MRQRSSEIESARNKWPQKHMVTMRNYQRMQNSLIVKVQHIGVQWLTRCKAEWRVNIDTVFVCVCVYIKQPQNLNPCGMRKMLWIAIVQTSRCICQQRYVAKCKDRAKITRFLGSNNGHSRSRHFDFSVGPDSARNFSGVATFGVDCHAAADAQVALKQK